VTQHYSQQTVAQRYLEVYQQCLTPQLKNQ